jgi:hypothetical protein
MLLAVATTQGTLPVFLEATALHIYGTGSYT